MDIPAAIPASVHQLLATLWDAGHAAYVVGGSLRDALLGVTPKDWDLATSAVPESTLASTGLACDSPSSSPVGLRVPQMTGRMSVGVSVEAGGRALSCWPEKPNVEKP